MDINESKDVEKTEFATVDEECGTVDGELGGVGSNETVDASAAAKAAAVRGEGVGGTARGV
jgi:hypothetical protein